jgi:hypothetical protein
MRPCTSHPERPRREWRTGAAAIILAEDSFFRSIAQRLNKINRGSEVKLMNLMVLCRHEHLDYLSWTTVKVVGRKKKRKDELLFQSG